MFGGAQQPDVGGGGFADIFKQFSRGRGGRREAHPTRGADLRHELTVPFATAVVGGEVAAEWIDHQAAFGFLLQTLGDQFAVYLHVHRHPEPSALAFLGTAAIGFVFFWRKFNAS
jgi:hypothetical protein